jgi:hypothetical protein
MSGDYYKEWRSKAEVDYYPQLTVIGDRPRFLESQDEPMRFRMVMEKDWKQTLVDEGL